MRGKVSFGYCSPWAAPGIPMKAVKWMLMRHAPLILRLKFDAAMLSWVFCMLSNCTANRYALNKRRMLRLADYSRIALAEVRRETQQTQVGRALSHLGIEHIAAYSPQARGRSERMHVRMGSSARRSEVRNSEKWPVG